MKITRSERSSAMRAVETRCAWSSPTTVLKPTSIPSKLSLSVKKRELVSWRNGVSNSEPTAMISASTNIKFNRLRANYGWPDKVKEIFQLHHGGTETLRKFMG